MLRDGIKQNWPEVVSQKVQRYTGVGFVHITVKENTGGLTTTSLAKLISQYLSHVSLHVLASSPAVCWMSSWAGGSGGRKEKGASSLAANEKVKMPVSWNKFLRFFFFLWPHPGHMKFPGQGYKLSHRCYPHYSCSNIRFFNPSCWPGIECHASLATRAAAVGFLTTVPCRELLRKGFWLAISVASRQSNETDRTTEFVKIVEGVAPQKNTGYCSQKILKKSCWKDTIL